MFGNKLVYVMGLVGLLETLFSNLMPAPPSSLAECIIVDFGDGYNNGPSFFPLENEQKSWIPMFPVTSDWSTVSPNGESTMHSMFPLHLCYAIAFVLCMEDLKEGTRSTFVWQTCGELRREGT